MALLALGAALLPSLYKAVAGGRQVRQGKQMNPVNPGFARNEGIIDNARILGERANNYQMQGYGQAVNNLDTGFQSSLAAGTQASSSGGDVLDLITKLNYNRGQNMNQLATQNAQGADQALMQSLNANAQAGQEYQDQNAYARDEYQRKLREKAALIQGGNQNVFGAVNDFSTAGTNLLNSFNPTGSAVSGVPSPQEYEKLKNQAKLGK